MAEFRATNSTVKTSSTNSGVTNDDEENEGPSLNISKLVLVNNVTSQEWKRSTPLKTYSKKSLNTPTVAAVSRYGRSHKPRIADGFLSTDKKVSQYLKIDTDNQLHYFKPGPYATYKSPNSKHSSNNVTPTSGTNNQQSISSTSTIPRKRGRPPKNRQNFVTSIDSLTPIGSGSNISSINDISATSLIKLETSTPKRLSGNHSSTIIGVGEKMRQQNYRHHQQSYSIAELNVPIPTSTETLPIPPELMDQAILVSDNEESDSLDPIDSSLDPIDDTLSASYGGTIVEMGPDGQPRWMVGDLAWACVGSFPFWPCTVTRDPFENAFTKLKFVGKFRQARDLIHVRFFGDHGRRSWVYKGNVLPFHGLDEFSVLSEQKYAPKIKKKFTVTATVRKAWQAAVSEAESLREAPRSERVKYFSETFPFSSKSGRKSSKKKKLFSETLSPDGTPIHQPKKRGRKRKSELPLDGSPAKKVKEEVEVKLEPNEDGCDIDETSGVDYLIEDDVKVKDDPDFVPDKKPSKPKVKKLVSMNQSSDGVEQIKIKKESVSPAKRGRGRPRKYPLPDQSLTPTTTVVTSTPSTSIASPSPVTTAKRKYIKKSVINNKKTDVAPSSENKNGNINENKKSSQQINSLEQSSTGLGDSLYQQEKKKSKLGPGFASFCEKHFDQVADEDPSLAPTEVNKYLEKMWSQLSDAVKARYRSKTQEEVEIESESDTETDSRKSPPQTVTAANKVVKRGASLFNGVKTEKVCIICLKSSEAGEVVKCRGPCLNYFHMECSSLPRYQQSRFAPQSGKSKKKRKRGRQKGMTGSGRPPKIRLGIENSASGGSIDKEDSNSSVCLNGDILRNSSEDTILEEDSSRSSSNDSKTMLDDLPVSGKPDESLSSNKGELNEGKDKAKEKGSDKMDLEEQSKNTENLEGETTLTEESSNPVSGTKVDMDEKTAVTREDVEGETAVIINDINSKAVPANKMNLDETAAAMEGLDENLDDDDNQSEDNLIINEDSTIDDTDIQLKPTVKDATSKTEEAVADVKEAPDTVKKDMNYTDEATDNKGASFIKEKDTENIETNVKDKENKDKSDEGKCKEEIKEEKNSKQSPAVENSETKTQTEHKERLEQSEELVVKKSINNNNDDNKVVTNSKDNFAKGNGPKDTVSKRKKVANKENINKSNSSKEVSKGNEKDGKDNCNENDINEDDNGRNISKNECKDSNVKDVSEKKVSETEQQTAEKELAPDETFTTAMNKDVKEEGEESKNDEKLGICSIEEVRDRIFKEEEKCKDAQEKLVDGLKDQDIKGDIKKDSADDKQSVDSDKSQTGKSGKEGGWMCSLCTEGKDGPCFICGVDSGEVVRCSTTHCGKGYHMKCLASWPQRQVAQSAKGKLILYCPQHTCHTCISDNPSAQNARFSYDKLVRCVACPSSYHYGNYCIPAGSELLSTTQMICPRHYVPLKESLAHINASWCSICAIGGSLICCDTCPNSFHAECLKIDPPEGSYICEDCETGRIPLYGEVVWVKLGAYRWWPAKILFPLEVPENIRTMNHSQVGEFVVEFFGTHDYFWINRGRAFFYHEGDGANILCKSRVDELFITGMNEASEAFRQYQVERESREANCRPSMKPPKYVKIQSNRPYGTLRSAENDVASLTACECDPEKENPCGRNSDCINRLLMVECNPQICPAGDKCQNQNFEKRLYPPLKPFKTDTRGWGLKTLVPLKKGEFVIEYVGEMIDEEEYKKRVIRKQKNKEENYYFLTIDKDRMLDAGPKGNMARFMNHSCNPNCETQKWTVNGDTRVGLFTLVDIPAGAELVFNYNLETIGNTRVDCKCGAPSCGGYIGAKVNKSEDKKSSVTKNNSKSNKKQSKKSNGGSTAGSNKNSSTKITEDTCFTCGEGGELLICDNSSCPKAYHLDCLGLTKHPPGNWECPRHVCSICSSTKVQRCSQCINSYCDKHAEGNITSHRTHGLVCFSCTPSESGSDWSGEASDDEECNSSKKADISQPIIVSKNNNGNSKSVKQLTSRRGRPIIPNGNIH